MIRVGDTGARDIRRDVRKEGREGREGREERDGRDKRRGGESILDKPFCSASF